MPIEINRLWSKKQLTKIKTLLCPCNNYLHQLLIEKAATQLQLLYWLPITYEKHQANTQFRLYCQNPCHYIATPQHGSKKMSHIAKTANPYGLPQLNHAGSHKKFCKLTSFQGFQLRLRTGHFCRPLNHNDLKLPGINP